MGDSDLRFEGKIALVTGSSRGIGRAIAVQLAREGADVLVNYRRRADAAAETVAQIQAVGRRAVAVMADMGNPDDIGRMFETLVETFGGLDFLICNAAAGVQSTVQETTLRAWDLAMNVNARALLLCAQSAAPLMQSRGGGRIIALTTRAGTEHAGPRYAPIAASKAAINALTVYLAVELGPHQIIANAVSPGLVATDSLFYFEAAGDYLQRAEALTPSGRATTPEDVAHLVVFLCSEQAHQINGQILEIDGGYRRIYH
jgi:enoyl-[acyl-carrier protein] reductase III